MKTTPLLVCAALAALLSACGNGKSSSQTEAKAEATSPAADTFSTDAETPAPAPERDFAEVRTEALMQEATVVLKQLLALQGAYKADKGAYAKSTEELKAVGWEDVTMANFEAPEIMVAAGERLCAQARPKRPDLSIARIDETGEVTFGEGCR